MPLCDKSFKFDLPQYNLDNIPYPIKNKRFDIFIALQVWEHISKRVEAFKEIKRISKHAILSFPYNRKNNDGMHGYINEKIINKWTSNIKPIKTIITGNMKSVKPIIGDNQKRIIYFWSFD